jgi:hypothetical protein
MQDEQLYITDPKALHHILVKDQQIFEETSGFVAYEMISLVPIHPTERAQSESSYLWAGTTIDSW